MSNLNIDYSDVEKALKKAKQENEDRKPINLTICIPCYGNMISMPTTMSLFNLAGLAPYKIEWIGNESLITRARNRLTYRFLADNAATHLLFLDADIEFKGEDVIRLVQANKDIILGAYSSKGFNFESIKAAIKHNPDITSNELEKVCGRLVLNFTDPNFKVNEPVEIVEGGTGFMLIKRNVFERLLKESDLLTESFCPYEGDSVTKYWATGPDDTGRELSEDYYFSHMCRKIGIKTYLHPMVELGHMGNFTFRSSIFEMAKLAQGSINKDI